MELSQNFLELCKLYKNDQFFDFFDLLLAYLFFFSPRIQFWSQKLEILILKRKKILTVPARFELSTPRLQGQNSTTELRLSQEFRAKKLVGSWNNSDWQFLKWIAGTGKITVLIFQFFLQYNIPDCCRVVPTGCLK